MRTPNWWAPICLGRADVWATSATSCLVHCGHSRSLERPTNVRISADPLETEARAATTAAPANAANASAASRTGHASKIYLSAANDRLLRVVAPFGSYRQVNCAPLLCRSCQTHSEHLRRNAKPPGRRQQRQPLTATRYLPAPADILAAALASSAHTFQLGQPRRQIISPARHCPLGRPISCLGPARPQTMSSAAHNVRLICSARPRIARRKRLAGVCLRWPIAHLHATCTLFALARRAGRGRGCSGFESRLELAPSQTRPVSS